MSVLELVQHGPVEQAGSLDTAAFDVAQLETEAALLHAREGLKAAVKSEVPGQVMAYEGQIKIGESCKVLSAADFPEIVGIEQIYADRWNRGSDLRGIRLSDVRSPGLFRRKTRRYYVSTRLEVYNKAMPICCLESYQRARELGVFDGFLVWERAKDYEDMWARVDKPATSLRRYPVVEVDPYLVGMVQFRIPDRVNLGENDEIDSEHFAASTRYFLIDRWDEIEPMP